MENYNVIMESENLYFINVSENLIDNYLEMINNPQISKFISLKEMNYSRESELSWVLEKLENNNYCYSLIEKKTNEFVGNIEIFNTEENNNVLGICITEKKQNNHYGTEAIKRILDYSFNILKLDSIELSVYSNNLKARHCYEKIGFVEYKTDKNIALRNNKPIDKIYMKIVNVKEKDYYNKLSNWEFGMINYQEESLTKWDLYDELKKHSMKDMYILDLGTGGGEKLLKNFPNVKKIIGTDYSEQMIKTAKKNLLISKRNNIEFKVMNNEKMDTCDEYFDIVVARHTCIYPKQIYKTLKRGGLLLVEGVDKYDCLSLKEIFKKGQGYNDIKPVSIIDYENIINAGFSHVELVPIHIREYYNTVDDLLALLLKTPIINDFNEEEDRKIDMNLLNKYVNENTTDKGILLIRRCYGIMAVKE